MGKHYNPKEINKEVTVEYSILKAYLPKGCEYMVWSSTNQIT